jgi:hypothetical protein
MVFQYIYKIFLRKRKRQFFWLTSICLCYAYLLLFLYEDARNRWILAKRTLEYEEKELNIAKCILLDDYFTF